MAESITGTSNSDELLNQMLLDVEMEALHRAQAIAEDWWNGCLLGSESADLSRRSSSSLLSTYGYGSNRRRISARIKHFVQLPKTLMTSIWQRVSGCKKPVVSVVRVSDVSGTSSVRRGWIGKRAVIASRIIVLLAVVILGSIAAQEVYRALAPLIPILIVLGLVMLLGGGMGLFIRNRW